MPICRKLCAVTILATLASACAYLAKNDKAPDLTIAAATDTDFPAVGAQPAQGLADYTYASQPYKAEWLSCKAKGAKATILIMHSDRAGFDSQRFCTGWMAQTFLAQGFDVVSVNRPGFGASTGTPDYFGAHSTAAISAGLAAATKGLSPLKGAWGYGTAATAACLYAKSNGKLSWLILGGGIYDLDEAEKTSTDSDLKKDIEQIRKTGGEKAIEDRSIAYDPSGLPKKLLIYHGKNDLDAPVRQAQAFGDSLNSAGYDATFQLIDGLTHDIPWNQHRKILEVLARSVAG